MWLNFEMLNLDCKALLSLNTLIMILEGIEEFRIYESTYEWLIRKQPETEAELLAALTAKKDVAC